MTELKSLNNTALFMPQLIMSNSELIDCPMFVNMYNNSKDYPWFENHIFILFKCKTISEINKLDDMLSRNDNFYNRYSIQIDGVFYDLAIFTVPVCFRHDFRAIKNGGNKVLTPKHKIAIFKIWKHSDRIDIEDYIYDVNYFGKCVDTVPLKDYREVNYVPLIDL